MDVIIDMTCGATTSMRPALGEYIEKMLHLASVEQKMASHSAFLTSVYLIAGSNQCFLESWETFRQSNDEIDYHFLSREHRVDGTFRAVQLAWKGHVTLHGQFQNHGDASENVSSIRLASLLSDATALALLNQFEKSAAFNLRLLTADNNPEAFGEFYRTLKKHKVSL